MLLCGWQFVLSCWRIVLLCLGVNLFIAIIALGPLSNILSEALSETVLHDKLNSGFDYLIVSDIIRVYSSGISASLSMIVSLVIPFFLWSVFTSGGFMGVIIHNPTKNKVIEFWKGGAYYFFKYLRFILYCLLGLLIFGAITFSIVTIGGLSPFNLESEGPLITRFYLGIAFMIITYFFIDLFKELMKVHIAKSDTRWFHQETSTSARALLAKHNLIMALMHVFIFILISFVYHLLKKLIGHWLIPMIICTQLFLFLKITFRFSKLASFHFLNRVDTPLPKYKI